MRALAAALLALAAATTAAYAEDVAVALTDEVVDVDAGFAGAKIVLFGALIGADRAPKDASPVDIVAVLRGPKADFRMRPMIKSGMIWTPGPSIIVAGAPSLLVASATRPLDEIAPQKTLLELSIGADPSAVAARLRPQSARAAAYVGAEGAIEVGRAFVERARAERRFDELTDAVEIEKNALFKIDLRLPPGTPVGAYFVDVYLFRDGALLAHDAASLTVSKVGVERALFDFAHDYAPAYGFLCVVLSLLAGAAAAAAFRK